MSSEILSGEVKKELARMVELNGGEVADENFEELERYLELNPKGSEYIYLDN